jgi:hypothetical protein
MQFDNNFCAEPFDRAGNRATEVLVDPASGAVGLEPGPATARVHAPVRRRCMRLRSWRGAARP